MNTYAENIVPEDAPEVVERVRLAKEAYAKLNDELTADVENRRVTQEQLNAVCTL